MELINIIINVIYNNSYQHTVTRLNKHSFAMTAIKHVTHALINYPQLAHLAIQDFICGKGLANHHVRKEPISLKKNA